MKVSLKWLSEYTAVPEDLKAFCDRLDLTGTGVEGVEKTGEAFEGVVVGHVLTCEPHPDSDHMHVVTVDVGAEEPVQIVCGAPNIAADIKVPVALVGAVLPAISRSRSRSCAVWRAAACAARSASWGWGRTTPASGCCPTMRRWGSPWRTSWAREIPCSTWRSRRTGRTACPWWAWPARWGPCISSRWPGRFPATWRNWLP